jgi:Probable zinc-ribbon domain
MKSSKQRREEIKARRRARAAVLHGMDRYAPLHELPLGAVAADPVQLAHNNTYGLLPQFYVDRPFTCRDCGADEVWTGKQQKWWYEVAKGHIHSAAIRCRPCRIEEQERVAAARVRAGHA